MSSVYHQLALFPLEKRCTTCGVTRPTSEFPTYHRRGRAGTYLRSTCKDCQRALDRERWSLRPRVQQAREKRRHVAQAVSKRCTRCGVLKPIEEFATYHKRGKDRSYLRSQCIACAREYGREMWPNTARAKRAEENRQRMAQAGEKTCSRCGLSKPRSAFGPRPERRGGMRSRCLLCEAELGRLRDPHTARRQTRALWAQGLQRCRRCGEIKPFADFYREHKRSHGHQSQCKRCTNARNDAYKMEHLPAHQAYHLRYNREHAETINGRQRLWAKAHPLARLARQSRREGILRHAEGTYTAADVRALLWAQAGCCAYCGRRVRLNVSRKAPEKATIDHVVPITRGGSNWPENLAIACHSCNSSKGSKLLSEWTDRWYRRPTPAS